MKMSAAKPDINDVNYDAYLANDRTLNDPEVIKVEKSSPDAKSNSAPTVKSLLEEVV